MTAARGVISGRAWCFGDHVNTDLILPGHALFLPPEEQARALFADHRPGWAQQVAPGDVVVAGRNFGTGSGRQIGSALRAAGVAAVVAESFNGLGMRNCINGGVAVQPCEGVLAVVAEGDVVELDWAAGRVRNVTTGATLEGPALPEALRAIVDAGGIMELLARAGHLAPSEGRARARA